MSGGTIERRGCVREVRETMGELFGAPTRPVAVLPELQPLPVTAPGFYEMPAAAYHADPCPEPSLSASLACTLVASTPAHARLTHPRLNPQHVEEEAEHFDIGEVAHAILLEGRDVVEILEFDNWRTNASKEARDKARADGKVPLLRKVWTPLEQMLAATGAQLAAHEDGRAMFRDGLAEPVLVWQEDGLWFRARLDWLRVLDSRRGYFAIDDFKTTSKSADPEDLSERTVWANGWDVKASFYRRGLYALTGCSAAFLFAVQECYAPYALSVLAPSPGAEMLGDMKVELAIQRWRRGLVHNDWHGYPKRTAYFEVPAWLERRWADREVRDAS